MIISRSAAETIDFGRRLAGELRPGDVVALNGDLGAGKTCLVKGLAAGLGITQDVTSPTFTIIHEYRSGRIPLVHVDLYRLESVPQIVATGLEDYFDGGGITVIEWANKVEPLLPATTRRIRLTVVDENTRRIEVT
jgi:tRNA threonylcarbamoyladenosine biosynthesis protein TsaE